MGGWGVAWMDGAEGTVKCRVGGTVLAVLSN